MTEILTTYSWAIKGAIWLLCGWMLGVLTIGLFAATDEPRGRNESQDL
jgi:hypothetical protein